MMTGIVILSRRRAFRLAWALIKMATGTRLIGLKVGFDGDETIILLGEKAIEREV